MKGYYEFALRASENSHEALLNKMIEMGSLGFVERENTLVAYFEENADVTRLCNELREFRGILESSGLNPEFSFDYVLLPGKDWGESWKEGIDAIDVGENITIAPSWINYETERITITIDPGMVFGTGHHETTRRCIMMLERFSHKKNRMSLLDVGTGTGILAITASKLGFHHVIAVDTDPVAVETARRNIEINGISAVKVRKGGIVGVEGTFDVIVANLYVEPLLEAAREIVKRLNPEGIAIFSGMLVGQDGEVIEAMKQASRNLVEKVCDRKWISLVFS
ncbi:MAG: 50S ribosomal protein L11 methyltransferase [Nitrospiraceae bacterium]|nr:MAG: 50S ribosomal protein L11 methyltransferase [Nitrospiraceae bacterium]